MRPGMAISIALLVAGALGCLLLRRDTVSPVGPAEHHPNARALTPPAG
jgi:hypothetical protein